MKYLYTFALLVLFVNASFAQQWRVVKVVEIGKSINGEIPVDSFLYEYNSPNRGSNIGRDTILYDRYQHYERRGDNKAVKRYESKRTYNKSNQVRTINFSRYPYPQNSNNVAKLQQSDTLEYDECRRLKYRRSYFFSDIGLETKITRYYYSYNEKHQLTHISGYVDAERRSNSSYNDKGDMDASELYYWKNGQYVLYSTSTYDNIYNDKGELVEQTHTVTTDSTRYVTRYRAHRYNSDGLPIWDSSVNWYTYNGKPHFFIYNYVYNDKKQLIRSSVRDYPNGDNGYTKEDVTQYQYTSFDHIDMQTRVVKSYNITATLPVLVEDSSVKKMYYEPHWPVVVDTAVKSINVFPVPAKDAVFIHLDVKAPTEVQAYIYNAMGKMVTHLNYMATADCSKRVPVGGLGSGTYHLVLLVGNEKRQGAFVVIQ
ncbi:MAG: hypothetical protein R2800_08225 [Flavipsychrobacter sp.]